MNEPRPGNEYDLLDWLHEQGKRRMETAPEFDVEATLRRVSAARDADRHAVAGIRERRVSSAGSSLNTDLRLQAVPQDTVVGTGDRQLVAAIVAGDPEGLAEAYDKYAAPLYTYCRSLLHEPADAADAVQDTFVIAASRLAGLRDRDQLRAWLYAVARGECRRRLRAKAAASALEEAPEMTDESADVSSDAERAELRALLREAILGLNPAEQEVVELQLRQGLDASEVGDVLDISRNHAHALISRARDQLEIALEALLVARTGREDCAELDTLLQGWDGHLTVLLRKRLHRHIERCPICTDRKRTALPPALLL
jgi:RNA polymerase sigma factor (sigma-70 family)